MGGRAVLGVHPAGRGDIGDDALTHLQTGGGTGGEKSRNPDRSLDATRMSHEIHQ